MQHAPNTPVPESPAPQPLSPDHSILEFRPLERDLSLASLGNEKTTVSDSASAVSDVDDDTLDFLKVEGTGCIGCLERIPLLLKLIFLGFVSLLGLICLGIWLIVYMGRQTDYAQQDYIFTTQQHKLVSDFTIALQQESAISTKYLATPTAVERVKLREQWQITDNLLTVFAKFLQSKINSKNEKEVQVLALLNADFELLSSTRDKTLDRILPAVRVINFYNEFAIDTIQFVFVLLSQRTIEPQLLSYSLYLQLYQATIHHSALGTLLFSGQNTTEVQQAFTASISQLRTVNATWQSVSDYRHIQTWMQNMQLIKSVNVMQQVALAQQQVPLQYWQANMTIMTTLLDGIGVELTSDASKNSQTTVNTNILQIVLAIIAAVVCFSIQIIVTCITSRTIIGPWQRLNALQETTIRKFIPQEFLRLLGFHRITDVKVGECAPHQIILVAGTVKNLPLDPQQALLALNRYLELVGPIVRKHYGFIERYTATGFVACFTTCRSAVKCTSEMKGVASATQVSFAIHMGMASLGIAGETERIQGMIVSEHLQEVLRLAKLTTRFNVPVIASRAFINKINFVKQCKYLGRIILDTSISASSIVQQDDQSKSGFLDIYEMKLNDKFLPEDLKMVTTFSKAMTFFVHGQYFDALKYFEESISQNANDGIARYFARLCATLTLQAKERIATLTIEDVLGDDFMLHAFETYTQKEKSAENVYFLKAVDNYKKSDPSARKALATSILSTFIATTAEKRVNTIENWFTVIEQKIQSAAQNDPGINLFDELNAEIALLIKDPYGRFKYSETAKQAFVQSKYNVPSMSFFDKENANVYFEQ